MGAQRHANGKEATQQNRPFRARNKHLSQRKDLPMNLSCSRSAFPHGRILLATATILAAAPAFANTDMQLNTTNFVTGQASMLSVDGLVSATGDSTSILGAAIVLRFDPAKVTLSNLHTDSSTNWSLLAYNTDHVADGWAIGLLYNTADAGQTADAPILLFTVTPADSSVDVNDCDTLRLSASESDYCDANFIDYQPTDACGGLARQSTPTGSSSASGDNTALVVNEICEDNIPLAAQALRIANGAQIATATDLANFDKDADGFITVRDAVAVLRSPCPSGWYTFQGDSQRSGRTLHDLNASPYSRWTDGQGKPAFVQLPGFAGNGSSYSPTVLAIPHSADSLYPILYAVSCVMNGTQPQSTVYRIPDTGDGSAPAPSASYTFNGVVTGTPLYYNGKLWITANNNGAGNLYVLDARTMTKAAIAGSNPVTYGGTADSSPVCNTNMGMVVVAANTSTGSPKGGTLFAYSAGDARQVTSLLMNSGFSAATTCSPVCRGDYAYVGDSQPGIDWLNLRTNVGNRTTLYAGQVATLAVHGNKLVAGLGSVAAVGQWTISDTDGGLSAYQGLGGQLSSALSTPAYVSETGASMFNYENGYVYAFHTMTNGTLENWFAGFQAVSGSDNSPLICGAPGTTAPVALVLPYQGGGQITKVALPQSAQSGLTPQYSTLTNTPVLAGSDAYSSSLTAYGPGTGSARIYFMTNQGKLYCFQ
jgi:hypothetical protein